MAKQTFKNVRLGNFTSPVGKAKYPKLNHPDTKFKDEGEFSVKLVLPTDSDEAIALVATIDEAYDKNAVEQREDLTEAKAEAMKEADKPYRQELDKDTDKPTGNLEFKFGMKASGKRAADGSIWHAKPDLFDSQAQPLPPGVIITGGSTIAVSYFISGWSTPLLGSGVSLKLKGVQLIELAGFNGSAEDQGFTVVAGGYSAAPAATESAAVDQDEEPGTGGEFA